MRASTNPSRSSRPIPRKRRRATPLRRDASGSPYPALSGYEFTEYYFVVSKDRSEFIGIDAGTRPDAAKEAYAALRAYAPDLPPLRAVFITHAHWDHVGGHGYFRSRVRLHWPEERLLFAGDILMPCMGTPFLEEGSLQGLLQQQARMGPVGCLRGYSKSRPALRRVLCQRRNYSQTDRGHGGRASRL